MGVFRRVGELGGFGRGGNSRVSVLETQSELASSFSRDAAVSKQNSAWRGLTTSRRVIAKLHTLAADPRNRPFIARDAGCLRNIIRTFDFPADDVSVLFCFVCLLRP